MGLLLNKIKGFDPGDLIAQLVGHLNNCVILENSLSYLRFSSSVSNGDAIFMQDRVSINAKWDNTPESAFIKKKKKKKVLKRMDMLENFPKRLGLSRKQGCLFCGGKMQAVRKSAHF